MQYNGSQEMSPEKIEMVKSFEAENPVLYDELANKKKWTHINKNSTKALKDLSMNNNFWYLLNHMPKSQVSSVVTPRILQMDQRSCDELLQGILEEKQQDGIKQSLIQRERMAARNKLAQRHNDRIAQAK